MKKKGFTLIEIISTIVIIGIIALITVPITIRVIREAKKRSFYATAEGIVKAASLSAVEKEEEYESYFLEKDSITFKFSKSEGKEGESVEEINGKKIKLSFSGKSPVGGEVKLYKNGDVEVVNLTDGTYYVNKDVDTELVLTEDSSTLTRDELQTALEALQKEVKNLKDASVAQQDKNKELESQIQNIDVVNKIYPIGSIYISENSTNPSTIFGGTWESYGTGRTLVGVNADNNKFDTVGKTGGNESTTLNESNLPSHTHNFTPQGTITSTFSNGLAETAGEHSHYINLYNGSGGSTTRYAPVTGTSYSVRMGTSADGNHTHTVKGTVTSTFLGQKDSTSSVGTGSSFSNLQPYITVYMWKRVA